jgi:uncharacterized damage-inducible protein DinB
MTPQEIKSLFAYNSWATNRVFESLIKVPEVDYRRDLKSSHGGIHGTLTHLVGAEKIWLSRWIGKPETSLMSEKEVPSLAALKEIWEDVAARTAKFISRLDDEKLLSTFEFTTMQGKTLTHVYQHALQHLVNHSTYHRGQIAALMRQVGAQPIGTDLIAFCRLTAQPVPKNQPLRLEGSKNL